MERNWTKIKKLSETFLHFFEKGYQRGYKEAQKEAVECMLFEGMDSNTIASMVGISMSEIETIKQNFNNDLGF